MFGFDFVNQQRIGHQLGSIQKCGYLNGMWGLFKRRTQSETCRIQNYQSNSDTKIPVIKLVISISNQKRFINNLVKL